MNENPGIPGGGRMEFLPARFAISGRLPWIPASTPGKWSKPLRFFADDRGFVELLKMNPGVAMPLHRHSGEIHAWNLSGSRQLCTGEIIGPGDYVYEPPGNTDWWQIVGDEPMTAFIVVMGTVEFIGPGGALRSRASAATQRADYERYCRENGIEPLDLTDP
jgi:2,4'-dihydroxyacetophenone dioxygenase